jgi:hypothetical protein
MTDVFLTNHIIPAAPGTRLVREGQSPTPVIGWRLLRGHKARPVIALAPEGMTVVVPQPDGTELSVSTPKAPPSEEE